MEKSNIYTITIINNLNAPISFTIKKWKLVLFISIFCVLFSIFACLSIAYFLIKLEDKKLQKLLVESNKKVELLTANITNKNQEIYFSDLEDSTQNRNEVKKALTEQTPFSTKGAWENYLQSQNSDENEAPILLKIQSFKPTLRRNRFTITMSIQNTSKPFKTMGGYVFVTLLNNKNEYVPLTKGEISKNGYPISYKSRVQYYLKRKTTRIKRSILIQNEEEFYTNAIVFIYSYRGNLLIKQTFSIPSSLFLE